MERTEEFDLLSKEIEKYPVLDREQERELFIDYKKHGSVKAKAMIVNCNYRLVVREASKFYKMGYKMEYMDMISNGMEGLLKAIEKFDYKTGNRLITYAILWIDQYIRRSCENETKFRKNMTYLDDYEDDENYKVDQILNSSITKYNFQSPEEETLEILKREEISEALEKLSEMEKFILKERFGFNGKPRTLSEIGNKIGKSKERVRQYEAQAIDALCSSENWELLKSYAA